MAKKTGNTPKTSTRQTPRTGVKQAPQTNTRKPTNSTGPRGSEASK